jgi:hypothetical protein
MQNMIQLNRRLPYNIIPVYLMIYPHKNELWENYTTLKDLQGRMC